MKPKCWAEAEVLDSQWRWNTFYRKVLKAESPQSEILIRNETVSRRTTESFFSFSISSSGQSGVWGNSASLSTNYFHFSIIQNPPKALSWNRKLFRSHVAEKRFSLPVSAVICFFFNDCLFEQWHNHFISLTVETLRAFTDRRTEKEL